MLLVNLVTEIMANRVEKTLVSHWVRRGLFNLQEGYQLVSVYGAFGCHWAGGEENHK